MYTYSMSLVYVPSIPNISAITGHATCTIHSIGAGRQFEVGVLNQPVRACARKGAGHEERSTAERNGLYICARKKRKLFAKKWGCYSTHSTHGSDIYVYTPFFRMLYTRNILTLCSACDRLHKNLSIHNIITPTLQC